jgi:hypothetical protein
MTEFYFIDGAMQTFAPTTGTDARDLLALGTKRSAEDHYAGLIDSVQIFSRGLSNQEITQIANQVPSPTTVALVAVGLLGAARI